MSVLLQLIPETSVLGVRRETLRIYYAPTIFISLIVHNFYVIELSPACRRATSKSLIEGLIAVYKVQESVHMRTAIESCA
jgi:hypothetical protein